METDQGLNEPFPERTAGALEQFPQTAGILDVEEEVWAETPHPQPLATPESEWAGPGSLQHSQHLWAIGP